MIGPQTPPEPRHTRVIACRDAAFRMDKLRRPLELCKISGLNSIATLLPCCLRLALPVTRQHSRLTNGSSLRFAVRVFHPLNHPPFSGRTFSKIISHDMKSFPEPYVRLSRIRLFIIIFTVSKQADINLWHCQWIIFQHFNESFSCITLSVTSSIQHLKQKFSHLLFVV